MQKASSSKYYTTIQILPHTAGLSGRDPKTGVFKAWKDGRPSQSWDHNTHHPTHTFTDGLPKGASHHKTVLTSKISWE